ncbi:hypothetical protein FSP39_013816 [Pinctada imbricata]|uniref:Uncharacterized protein n=1 Tax=Pinctada imbricata TaxID=66713 RepID=A0AA88XFP1_PINIB|nr:hypothetical protein FSP39_013816 [Pinctada imbricata]
MTQQITILVKLSYGLPRLCPFSCGCFRADARFIKVYYGFSRRAKECVSRFVTFSHGTSRLVTVNFKFYYGLTRHARSHKKYNKPNPFMQLFVSPFPGGHG